MTNWKQTAAAAIVTHEAPVTTADNSDLSLWHQLKAAIEDGKVAERSLDFAKSVMGGFVKYGSFTPKQADAVRNLLARANGQAEPNPVAGPDKPLADALRAALPSLAPSDVNFATSLLSGFDRFGGFTDRQRPYAEKLARSVPAMQQAPSAPEKPVATTCPNICAKVSLNGFSRFTVGKLALSLKNDGTCIWVKWDGKIAGVIDTGSTVYRQTRRYLADYALAACLAALLAVEADPLAAARENGVKTGRCSCCGRPLTDPTSIEFGIGPICRVRGFGINL
jgi:hypothetical protein